VLPLTAFGVKESPGDGALIYYAFTPKSLRDHRRARRSVHRRLFLVALCLAIGILVVATHPKATVTKGVTSVANAAPIHNQTQATPTSPTSSSFVPVESPSAQPVSEMTVLASAIRVSTPSPIPRPPLRGKPEAEYQLETIVAGQKGSYALYVLDMPSQQWYGFSADDQVDAASVNKVAILAALYHEVGLSRMSLDSIITTKPNDIQDYGTGSIRYDPIGSSYTLRTLAKLMTEQSDNTASYLVAQAVGLQTIQSLTVSWGLRKTVVGDATTSAREIGSLFDMIYRGQVAPPALTLEMIDFLTHTDTRDRIPALLPSDLRIAHKIGNHVGVLNDAGIVYLADRPYIIVIMGQNIDEEQGLLIEQNLSKAVYDYESSLAQIT
jgi:beta-lactamase class A